MKSFAFWTFDELRVWLEPTAGISTEEYCAWNSLAKEKFIYGKSRIQHPVNYQRM